MNNNYFKALLIICVILILGIIGGIAGSTIYHKQFRKERFTERNFSPRGVGRMEHRLSRELDLDPQQLEAVRLELENVSHQFERLKTEIRPRFHQIHEELTRGIEKHLRSDQLEKFREIQKFHEERRSRGGHGHRRGSGFDGDHPFNCSPQFNDDFEHLKLPPGAE